MAEFENFGFYTIDADYLEYLNNKNSEVYYNASYRNAIKPFVGIIIDMTECKYFIPLTSAKEKHKKWKNSCDEHFLIYEVIDKSVNISGDVYKEYSKDKKMHVLSVLDIKKMIPFRMTLTKELYLMSWAMNVIRTYLKRNMLFA